MGLYRVELKRQLKTRSVRLLLLFSLLITFVLACCPISFVEYAYEENGQETLVKGIDAISMREEAWKAYSGEVTEEKIAAALAQYQESYAQYGEDGMWFDMPDSEYCEKIAPISSLVYRLREVNADSKTGAAPSYQELTEEDALRFYDRCVQRLDDVLRMEQSAHPAAVRQAKALYSAVEMPFTYYPGFNIDALDYQVILTFVFTIVGALIAAPIFSSDYQTGSDNILRCAKYGRTPLALAKIKATLTITSLMYLICMSIYLLVEGFAFGWDTLKTSVQLIWSASSLLPITIGQLMLLSAAVGLLAFLATVLCILFLSAVCKSVYASSSLSLLLCMLPILTYSLLPERIDLWVRSFLPDGGIGLANSFLYEVLFLNFLHLGDLSLWYPFALLLGSVLEIPLWLWASVHAYKRHHL